MAQELTCNDLNIGFRPFGDEFLRHQRFSAPVLSARAASCYKPLQDLESKQLLSNLLTTKDLAAQFTRFSASVVYSLAFGFRVETGEEWQLQENREVMDNLFKACQVGSWIVEAFPILNHLPAPLAPWKSTAAGWYKKVDTLYMTNYQDALKRDGWNWSKDLANSKKAFQINEVEASWDVGNICDAAVETTASVLHMLILACLAHPDWIPKAQKELDTVVGGERLPTFEDLGKLPYIAAVIEENFRWRNILPTGLPHATTKDDYYNGYLIPKGSTIIPLFMAMRNDTRLFDSPEEFRPERWIGKAQHGNFGYGHRVCPGRFIARNSLAIAIARLLWAFNIRSKDGIKPVIREEMFTAGFASSPKSFEAVIEPRSEKHRQVIEQSWEMTEKDIAKVLNGISETLISTGLKTGT
jgi:cytochrome P450